MKAFIQHGSPVEEENFPFLVLGNKSDLKDEVLIRTNEVKQWCEDRPNVEYMEVSAKDNVSVEDAFYKIIEKGSKREVTSDMLDRKVMTRGRKLNISKVKQNSTKNGKKKKN